ncbi:MAG: D-hexose-6-phosphate mutarotase, partial [Cyanobacteria bacterium J06649_11]
TNSKTAIVWNPGAEIAANMADLGADDYLNFVCVETANAANEVIKVAAGQQYQLSANYAIANN